MAGFCICKRDESSPRRIMRCRDSENDKPCDDRGTCYRCKNDTVAWFNSMVQPHLKSAQYPDGWDGPGLAPESYWPFVIDLAWARGIRDEALRRISNCDLFDCEDENTEGRGDGDGDRPGERVMDVLDWLVMTIQTEEGQAAFAAGLATTVSIMLL